MSDDSAKINAINLGGLLTCRDLGTSIRFYRDAIGISVVDPAANRIRSTGASLIDEPADRSLGTRMFQFRDPDGFKVGVSCPLAG